MTNRAAIAPALASRVIDPALLVPNRHNLDHRDPMRRKLPKRDAAPEVRRPATSRRAAEVISNPMRGDLAEWDADPAPPVD